MMYNWNYMQRLKQLLLDRWQSIALYGVLFVALGFLLVWKLNSLVPGYSAAEVASYQQAFNIGNLLDNPLNAPFILAVRALTYVHADSYLVTRIVSVGVGLATLGFFCWLLRQWYDRRTTVIGTIMFGMSAWFLHAARLGSPEVLMLGITALLACGVWLRQSKSWIALLACFALIALFIYVPGMIWFLIVGMFWQWKTIDKAFKDHLLIVSVGALVLLLALAPLAWAIYRNTHLLLHWLAIPSSWPAPLEIVKNILKVPYHLVVSNAPDPAAWLGTAPVLDIFSVVMFILGGYLYLRHITLIRTPVFLSILVIGTLLIGLMGGASFSFILPCIYIVIAAGVSYLLNQWLRVFPRNPIARGLGITLIIALVAFSSIYHLRHYFVGWPQAQATHDIYTAKKP
jgi:hypothetical protein